MPATIEPRKAATAGGTAAISTSSRRNVLATAPISAAAAAIDTQAAEKLKDAERLEAPYQSKLSSVDAAAARKRAAAQRETERMVQQQLSDAHAQADQIIANAHAAAQREHDKALAEAQDELKELAVTATEKLVLQAKGDAFDQFLELAERGGSHE